MSKRVIDVGNCSYDHGNLQSLIEGNFDAVLVQTHGFEDTLAELKNGADLVLVNRQFDQDGSDGVEFLQRLKSTPECASVPLMLLTNFPEYQQAARKAGAEIGFGKKELGAPETLEKLKRFLGA